MVVRDMNSFTPITLDNLDQSHHFVLTGSLSFRVNRRARCIAASADLSASPRKSPQRMEIPQHLFLPFSTAIIYVMKKVNWLHSWSRLLLWSHVLGVIGFYIALWIRTARQEIKRAKASSACMP